MAPNPKYDSSCKPLPESAKPLSLAECRLLWAIRKFFKENRHTPSVRELAEISKAPLRTCYDQIDRLAERGYIDLAETSHRNILGLTRKGVAAVRSNEKLVRSLVSQ